MVLKNTIDMTALIITKPIVTVDWLQLNLENKNLIILDCTIPKVTDTLITLEEKKQVKGAVFCDIKNMFSDKKAPYPNTVLSPKEFEIKARELGIDNDSCIVCYDDLGMYSSPRVWWMFQLMGFTNVGVLNGGLPEWKAKKYPVETPKKGQNIKGNFKVSYKSEKLKYTKEILSAIKNENILIADARSKGRFYATEPEPRKGVKGGHIPNSVSLPFSKIIENGKLKSEENLKEIFKEINPKKKDLVFSCGTGITASILALGAEMAQINNYAVYDGSWTEWGSTEGLPIEK